MLQDRPLGLTAPASVALLSSVDQRHSVPMHCPESLATRYDATHLLRVSHAGMATKTAGVADEIAYACRPGNSFRRDTQVLMADGSRRAIGELAVGDKVIATDPETGFTAAEVGG